MPSDQPVVIDIKVSGDFEIRLETPAGGGYLWEIESMSDCIAMKVKEFEFGENAPPGTPTVQVFRFQVTAPCSGAISLILRRPWEQHIHSRRVYHINTDK